MNGNLCELFHSLRNVVREIPSGLVISARLILGSGLIWTCHLAGYLSKIGIGLNNLVGTEVSGDLFFEILQSLALALISVIPIAYLAYVISKKWFPVALLLGIVAFLLATTFYYSYIGHFGFGAILGYSTSTRFVWIALVALVVSIFIIFVNSNRGVAHSLAIIASVSSISYFLGELKAGSANGSRWYIVHFQDGTQLPAFVLRRARDGLILKKRDYFAFDIGTVFVPYASIKMLAEPQRVDGSGEGVFQNDYPSFSAPKEQKK